jgi:S1-C subfamily serine protease
MRPELMPRGDAEAEADLERKHFALRREPGEKLGASVAADGTILGYTGSDSAAARASLPKGWKIIAVDHAEVACLEQLKQRLGECSPGAAVVLTCAPRRASAG